MLVSGQNGPKIEHIVSCLESFVIFFPLKQSERRIVVVLVCPLLLLELISSKFFVGAGFFGFVLFFLMKLHYLTFKK